MPAVMARTACLACPCQPPPPMVESHVWLLRSPVLQYLPAPLAPPPPCSAFNFPGGYSLKPSGAVLVRGFAIKNWITNGGAVQTVRFTGPGGLPVVDVDIPEPQRTWNFNSWNRTAYALPTPFLVPANAVGYTMQALGAPGAFTDPPVSAFVVFSDITAFVVE